MYDDLIYYNMFLKTYIKVKPKSSNRFTCYKDSVPN